MTDRSALTITSGEDLQRFDLGTFRLNGSEYNILTGFEGNQDGLCFWCGQPIKGRSKKYCRGHLELYYNHFDWQYASIEALKRAGRKCENCGGAFHRHDLEVHHIIPLKGSSRQFTAYNLSWNLIVFCHSCHQLIHAIMREIENPKPLFKPSVLNVYDRARMIGQGVLLEV